MKPSGAKDRITVAHVILGLDVGGMEQVVADLVEALDPSRFTPVVVCLQLFGRSPRRSAPGGSE